MLSLRAVGGTSVSRRFWWTKVVVVAGQTEKWNTSEQIVPINPDNNTQS